MKSSTRRKIILIVAVLTALMYFFAFILPDTEIRPYDDSCKLKTINKGTLAAFCNMSIIDANTNVRTKTTFKYSTMFGESYFEKPKVGVYTYDNFDSYRPNIDTKSVAKSNSEAIYEFDERTKTGTIYWNFTTKEKSTYIFVVFTEPLDQSKLYFSYDKEEPSILKRSLLGIAVILTLVTAIVELRTRYKKKS